MCLVWYPPTLWINVLKHSCQILLFCHSAFNCTDSHNLFVIYKDQDNIKNTSSRISSNFPVTSQCQSTAMLVVRTVIRWYIYSSEFIPDYNHHLIWSHKNITYICVYMMFLTMYLFKKSLCRDYNSKKARDRSLHPYVEINFQQNNFYYSGRKSHSNSLFRKLHCREF